MAQHDDEAVRIDVLGPMQAWQARQPVPLGSTQQQSVLGALVLSAGRPVGREYLIAAVWGEESPSYAVNLLQKHVSALRQALDPDRANPALLRWTNVGYVLALDTNAVDLHRAQRHADDARRLRAAGELQPASLELRHALAMWRGMAFDGLPGPLMESERDRLDELWATLAEERLRVELQLGRHRELIGELTDLSRRYPLRESIWEALLLALVRAGRAPEALTTFQRVRAILRDELGVDPSVNLRRLHQSILSADPALFLDRPDRAAVPIEGQPDAGARTETAAPPIAGRQAEDPPTAGHHVQGPAGIIRPPPAQLPHRMRGFVGRGPQLRTLSRWLDEQDADPRSGMGIFAITGTAGVGKTALAVDWAHEIRHRFPDGQLYVNLRGFDPSGAEVEPGVAIRGFVDALTGAADDEQVTTRDQSALYRSLLADRRVLLLLDNARDADQVRDILPGASDCTVIVTSRSQLGGLLSREGGRALSLDLLSEEESRELLGSRISADRIAAEPEAVARIVAACARLPIALAVVGARAATYPTFPLVDISAELHAAKNRLDAFDSSDSAMDVRAVFSWSYRRLSPDAAGLFRTLGIHPGPDVALAGVASLIGRSLLKTRVLIDELLSAHLVTQRVPQRFTLHDLLRDYAADLARRLDPVGERDAIGRRMLAHYVYSARNASAQFAAERVAEIALPSPPDDIVVVEFDHRAQALAWCRAELATLFLAWTYASEHGHDERQWQLACAAEPFLRYRGYTVDAARLTHDALPAAKRSSDPSAEPLVRRLYGVALILLGRYPQAHEQLEQSAALYDRLADPAGHARVLRSVSSLLGREADYGQATRYAARALDLFREAGDTGGEAQALNAVGWFNALNGDAGAALAYCTEALDLQQQLDDRVGEADTWDSVGYIHIALGQSAAGIDAYRHAVELYATLEDRYNEADSLVNLGDALRDAGDTTHASTAWARALTLFTEIGHADAGRARRRLDG